ncbi:MAG: protein kinase [Bryobacteraceae bacterium]|jgi:Tol biopolymer transport system component
MIETKMSFAPGTRVGPYEIEVLLGAGGMGEVYRARDERLNRAVAIKVLHASALGDSESRRRFAQEARAVSALNHPNILTVHDIGAADGSPYIVTELVDGESLATIVERGPVPVRKFLEIAAQAASGLAAAHAAGIVHRDVKPNNVMVRRDGCVKILDFGIAKMTGAHDPAAGEGETVPGMVVGTASYMSPEQARGEALDFRSDQFSLGLTFYRMLTGKLAFERTSAVGSMAAIIEEEVPPLAASVPSPVRWIVERCLAKDRDGRYASTHDLCLELKLLQGRLSEMTGEKPAQALPAPVKRRSGPLLWLSAAALAVGLVGGLLLAPPPGADLSGYRMSPLATEPGYKSSPAWAPNGASIAYSADAEGVRQIFVRSLASPTPAQITKAPADCEAPFWSADSSTVYYLMSADLWATGAAGGLAELVQDNVSAAAPSPDGNRLAFLRIDRRGKQPISLWIASPPRGAAARRSFAPLETGMYGEGHLAFSRNGEKLGVWLAGWGGRSEFWLLPIPVGEPRKAFGLPQGASGFSWMTDNRTVAFAGLAPGASSPDLNLADTRTGLVRPITVTVDSAIEPAVSPDGDQVAFTVVHDDFDLVQIPVDGAAIATVPSTARNELDPSWSPVADEYAYSTDRTGTAQIWLRSRSGDWERPLVTEKDFPQAWVTALRETTFSWDGQRIAYAVAGSNGHSVSISSVRGGSPLRLTSGQADQESPSWNPDGSWIAYLESAGGSWTLKKARPGGSGEAVTLRQGCLRSHPKWSKRGDWIACVTSEGLTLVSPEGGAAKVIAQASWLVYGWDFSGSKIYGVKETAGRGGALASIDVDTGAEKTVSNLNLPPRAILSCYSMARDGKSFMTSVNHPTADLWLLKGFERRLPWWQSWWRFTR